MKWNVFFYIMMIFFLLWTVKHIIFMHALILLGFDLKLYNLVNFQPWCITGWEKLRGNPGTSSELWPLTCSCRIMATCTSPRWPTWTTTTTTARSPSPVSPPKMSGTSSPAVRPVFPSNLTSCIKVSQKYHEDSESRYVYGGQLAFIGYFRIKNAYVKKKLCVFNSLFERKNR